jgi:oligopeptide transport system substrate-binding protein
MTALFVRLVLLLSLSTPVAAVGSEPATLHRGNSAEPLSLDPAQAEDVASGNILRDLFEGLVTEGPDGSLQSGTAESWRTSPDGTRYTFVLRDGLRWSNGDPLTSGDFAYAMRRALDPASAAPMASLLQPIGNADAIMLGQRSPAELAVATPDPQTLVIDLEQPAAWFLQVLTHPIAFPVHAASIEKHGDKAFGNGRLVSNGAYQLLDWVPYEKLSLARSEHYHSPASEGFERVVYYPIDNNNAELNRYRAGELDWTDTIPPNKLRSLRTDHATEIFVSPYLGTYYYGFNLTREPFQDNPKLRRALSLAIDRQIITDKILGNGEISTRRWLPPGFGKVTPIAEPLSPGRKQSITEAQRLYREAGYGPDKPLKVTLHYNTSEQHKRIAIAVAAMWKKQLGVRTELINEEWKVFLQRRKGKTDTQLFRASWIADFNDAISFLALFSTGHAKNDTGYSNPQYDELVRRIAVQNDSEKRDKLVREAEELLLDDQVVIPIYHYVSRHLVKPDIGGYQANPLDHHYSRYLYRKAPSRQ